MRAYFTGLFAAAGAILLAIGSNLAHNWRVSLLISSGLACLMMTWLIPYYANKATKKKQRKENPA